MNELMLTDMEVVSLIEQSLDEFLKSQDNWLLKNDLSEQSISHRFANHIENNFKNYNIDCEYNGNCLAPSLKKSIGLLKIELKKFGLLRDKEASTLEREFTQRAVFPDIIIHRRGTNKHNLCILEIKKSTSRVSFCYDFLKLCSYTSNLYGNNLAYQLGIFVRFIIDDKNPSYSLRCFKQGKELEIQRKI